MLDIFFWRFIYYKSMTELEEITNLIHSDGFKTLPKAVRKELRMKQQAMLRKAVRQTLKENLEPLLMEYELDSDIRIYNDGEDGIKVEFVDYWSDVNTQVTPPPTLVKEQPFVEPTPQPIIEPSVFEETTEETRQKLEHVEKPDSKVKELALEAPSKETAKYSPTNGKIIFRHLLDWSPFEYGFTIDKEYHDAIFESLGGPLAKGTSKDVYLLLDDLRFDVKIGNADLNGRPDNCVRLLYRHKDEHPGLYLRHIFKKTYEYIKGEKDMLGGRAQVKLPDDLKVMLHVEETDAPFVYRMTYQSWDKRSANSSDETIAQNTKKYVELFKQLNVNHNLGSPAPHKAIMLITMMNMIRAGKINGNLFEPTQYAISLFSVNWITYIKGKCAYNNDFWTPFFYMNSEPFWTLCPSTKTPTEGLYIENLTCTLVKKYLYATRINEDLIDVIRDDKGYTALLNTLVENYLYSYTK